MRTRTAYTSMWSVVLLTTAAAFNVRLNTSAKAVPTWVEMSNAAAYGSNGGLQSTGGGWSSSYAISNMGGGSTEVEWRVGTTSGEVMLGLYGGDPVDTHGAIYDNSKPYFMIYKHLHGSWYVKETGRSFAYRPPGVNFSPDWVNDVFKLSVTQTGNVDFTATAQSSGPAPKPWVCLTSYLPV